MNKKQNTKSRLSKITSLSLHDGIEATKTVVSKLKNIKIVLPVQVKVNPDFRHAVSSRVVGGLIKLRDFSDRLATKIED